jgi:hypothetical protein
VDDPMPHLHKNSRVLAARLSSRGGSA